MRFHRGVGNLTPIPTRSQLQFLGGGQNLRPLNSKPVLDKLAQRRELDKVERRSTLVRNFAIAGCVLAELYMVLSVAAPRLKGVEMPPAALASRLLASSLLFGPFGLAMGTGVGLLADGLRRSVLKSREDKKDRIV